MVDKVELEAEENFKTPGGMDLVLSMEPGGLWYIYSPGGFTPTTLRDLKYTNRNKAKETLEAYLRVKESQPLRKKYGSRQDNKTLPNLRSGTED